MFVLSYLLSDIEISWHLQLHIEGDEFKSLGLDNFFYYLGEWLDLLCSPCFDSLTFAIWKFIVYSVVLQWRILLAARFLVLPGYIHSCPNSWFLGIYLLMFLYANYFNLSDYQKCKQNDIPISLHHCLSGSDEKSCISHVQFVGVSLAA